MGGMAGGRGVRGDEPNKKGGPSKNPKVNNRGGTIILNLRVDGESHLYVVFRTVLVLAIFWPLPVEIACVFSKI